MNEEEEGEEGDFCFTEEPLDIETWEDDHVEQVAEKLAEKIKEDLKNPLLKKVGPISVKLMGLPRYFVYDS